MSLRVWLPLDGTLDNQGLDDTIVVNNGATVDNSGKIGKCYNFNGSSYLTASLPNLSSYSTTACSMAVWIKVPNPSSGNKQILNIGTSSGWANIRFGLLYRTNSSEVITNISNGTNYVAYSCNASIVPETWVHVATVYQNKHLKIYINGQLKKTFITTYDISFNGITKLGIGAAPNGNEKYTGYLNDVRIYDHALSPMEVKQISQGLILHYPLNNNGWGQENLLIDTLKDQNKTHTTYNISDYNFSEHLVEGEEYTITASVTTSSEKTFVGMFHSGGSYSMSEWMKINKNGFYQKTFTATANMANRTQGIGYGFCRVYVSNNPSGMQGSYALAGTANVNWIKIEKGDKATPWCPNEADELYNIIRLNDNIQYDTSGYNHNLKNFNKSSFSSDTPRYSVSTKLAGTSYGTHQYLFLNDNYQKELTVSCWIKRTSSENVSRYISNSWIALYLYSDFAPRISWKNSTGTSDILNTWAPGGAIPINTWTHICFTIKDGIVEYYKNGTHISTSDRTQYGTLIHGSLSNGFGGESLTSNNWIGGLSDFRFYCTALSTEDILALYKNSVYIDNEGNLYGTELREV